MPTRDDDWNAHDERERDNVLRGNFEVRGLKPDRGPPSTVGCGATLAILALALGGLLRRNA